MSERVINQFLQTARKAAENQYKRGNTKNGDYILSEASKVANKLLEASELNGNVRCGHCQKLSWDAGERDYVRAFGFCFSCEDIYDDVRNENSN